MLPCNSCYICGTWSNKKVRSLKSSYGGKEKIRKEGEFSWGGVIFSGGNFHRGQFSRGQIYGGNFHRWKLSQEGYTQGVIFSWAIFWGVISWGTVFWGVNFPDETQNMKCTEISQHDFAFSLYCYFFLATVFICGFSVQPTAFDGCTAI